MSDTPPTVHEHPGLALCKGVWEKRGVCLSSPTLAPSGHGLNGVTSLWPKLPSSILRHMWKVPFSYLIVTLRPFQKPTQWHHGNQKRMWALNKQGQRTGWETMLDTGTN